MLNEAASVPTERIRESIIIRIRRSNRSPDVCARSRALCDRPRRAGTIREHGVMLNYICNVDGDHQYYHSRHSHQKRQPRTVTE